MLGWPRAGQRWAVEQVAKGRRKDGEYMWALAIRAPINDSTCILAQLSKRCKSHA